MEHLNTRNHQPAILTHTADPIILRPKNGNKGDGTMKNVEMTVEGNILTIKVYLSKEFGPSSSGKTVIIASTEGNVSIPGAEEKKIGLNVYRKK